jgi:hypothetical protein
MAIPVSSRSAALIGGSRLRPCRGASAPRCPQESSRRRPRFIQALFCLVTLTPCHAQIYLNNLPVAHPKIRYFEEPASDPIANLSKQLTWSGDKFGYLPDLLEKLGIAADTQILAFSKSSFQGPKISPRNPRAIYFTDNAAVGFVPGGDGLEVAALDPKQGIILYALTRDETGDPRFTRKEVCLTCHQGPSTMGVPGIFIGSVFPNADGMPAREGAIVTDHRTPFEDRWGGWYVSAAHGEQKDRANAVAANPAEPDVLDTPLEGKFNVNNYLRPTSDIVALMTFEHQTQMVNLFTRLNWEARMDKTTDADLEATVAYMLFTDEPRLKEAIEGVSTFTKTFPQRGPRDSHGRSLRDFDLHTRLFRYPLSYMIYSPQFDALPDDIRQRIYRRLHEILKTSGGREILEILEQTKPEAREGE